MLTQWIQFKTWSVWIVFLLMINHTKASSPLCVFGDQDAGCLLPCRCDNGCDKDTGNCNDGGSCTLDNFLNGHSPDGLEYWRGDACQTGDVGRGKPATQEGTYRNSGFNVVASAGLAVDGNISTYAYSQNRPIAWWSLDLGYSHQIENVYIIANNLGNNLIKLDNYTVWVGMDEDVFTHSLCGLAPKTLERTLSSDSVNWNKVDCNAQGRYVSIRKSDDDPVKHWLPIHEVAIIGYPVVSTHMGRCLKHKENSGTTPSLLSLECEQCAYGWMEPYCRFPNNSTGESSTAVLETSPTVAKTTTSTKRSTTNGGVFPISSTSPTNIMNHTEVGIQEESNGVALTVILLSVIPVLVVLVIISAVLIPCLCIKLRRMKKRNQVVQNTNTNAPIYFKRDDVEHYEKPPDVGYHSLMRNQPEDIGAYTDLKHDNQTGDNYYSLPVDKRDPRHLIGQSTPSVFDGTTEYLGSNGHTYTNTFASRDAEGYMTPQKSQKYKEQKVGNENGKEQKVGNENGAMSIQNLEDDEGYNILPVDKENSDKTDHMYLSIN